MTETPSADAPASDDDATHGRRSLVIQRPATKGGSE